jgi:hypothetical protein
MINRKHQMTALTHIVLSARTGEECSEDLFQAVG